jgi:hypothetical protein
MVRMEVGVMRSCYDLKMDRTTSVSVRQGEFGSISQRLNSKTWLRADSHGLYRKLCNPN